MICLIFASDLSGNIGNDNKLPWDLPEDLKRFRELTTGHTVLMGRKTYESLPCYPNGLPGRTNIVVTRHGINTPEGVQVINDLESYLRDFPKDETLWVIGGGEIYEASLPYVDKIYHTLIDIRVNGDTKFIVPESNDFSLESLDKFGFDNPDSPKYWNIVYSRI